MENTYSSDLTGRYLGQYQILERITKGSTSTIYKAYQPKLERYVAVKVLSPHVIDEEGFLDRFALEARAIAQLDHPNIVPVYDFDQAGEMVYIVMKYVEGGTAKEMLSIGHPIELGTVIELVSQVGRALDYAHKRGVIHRDVKPSNILIAEENWALLTDFGLAKMMSDEKKLTRSGIGMGTPDYMSPEQAQGFDIDARTDVYSLGATVYEMLAGRVPFEAESSMAVVVKHMTEPPPPLRAYNPDLPAGVEKAINRAMEKDPDQRYQSVMDFVKALTDAATSYSAKQAVPKASNNAVQLAEDVLKERQAAAKAARSTSRPGSKPRTPSISQPGPKPSSTPSARPKVDRRTTISAQSFSAMLQKNKMRVVAMGAAMVVLIVVLGAIVVLKPQINGWPFAASSPQTTPSQPARTATLTPTLGPSSTPSTPPTPTSSPTITPTPTPTQANRPLSPDAPVRVGIYVKVVNPDGLNLSKQPGFDGEFLTTIPAGATMYVLGGPQVANNLTWIYVSGHGWRGWGRQDQVIAYAEPVVTTPQP